MSLAFDAMRNSISSKLLTISLLATVCSVGATGCTTVQTTKQASIASDRSASGGAAELGDPAAPADKVVIAAANGQMSDPSDKQAADKHAANSKNSATLSETREQRLRQVAADFDQRRDEAQYQAALNRWREDDSAGCRQSLEQLIARNPQHCPARLLMAQVCLSDGNAKAALEQVRQVLALEPKNAEAHYLMGLSLDGLGETGPAIAEYEKATRLDSQNEQYAACYHAALDSLSPPAAVSRAAPAPQPNAFSDSSSPRVPAKSTVCEARTTSPAGTGRVVQASGEAPLEAGRDDSNAAGQGVADAIQALRDNRLQDSVRIAAAALAEDPHSAALFRVLGVAEYRLGNYKAAQVAISQALSLDKSDALTYFLMGSTLVRLGQNEAAERQFAEAARLDPRYSRHD